MLFMQLTACLPTTENHQEQELPAHGALSSTPHPDLHTAAHCLHMTCRKFKPQPYERYEAVFQARLLLLKRREVGQTLCLKLCLICTAASFQDYVCEASWSRYIPWSYNTSFNEISLAMTSDLWGPGKRKLYGEKRGL